MALLDILLDENNNENIVMYNEFGKPVEFEQIAVIPFDQIVYVILKPAQPMDGIDSNQAIVFRIDGEGLDAVLTLVENDIIIDAVFTIYYDLLEKAEGNEIH